MRQTQRGVEADCEHLPSGVRRTVAGEFLVGADGPRSLVRSYIEASYEGETGIVRNFMGGRMYAIYVRAPAFYELSRHGRAWMYVTVNSERRAFMAAVDGKGEFAFHTQLQSGEQESEISESDARAMFSAAMGVPIDLKVLSRGAWTAGHTLVADRFRRGRIFLGGDATHLFTPTGGLGYNTAIEDAVNLAWKLAAVLKGQCGVGLLDTYEIERRAIAQRNTRYARAFADSLGNFAVPPEIEDDTPEGAKARELAGAYFNTHARAEFDIPGITFGGRYDGPGIIPDGTAPTADSVNEYRPTARPGGRPPHLWLAEGCSLFDAFGPEWTLVRLGPTAVDPEPFVRSAHELAIPLDIVTVPSGEARELYEADLAIIRPDQIVAWRGNDATKASAILVRLTFRKLQSEQVVDARHSIVGSYD